MGLFVGRKRSITATGLPLLRLSHFTMISPQTPFLLPHLSRDITFVSIVGFYCAMLRIRGTSHGPVSVCPSVCVCHKSEFY